MILGSSMTRGASFLRVLSWAVLLVGVAALAPACGQEQDVGKLQELDFKKPEGSEATFDRNSLIDTPSFVDFGGIDTAMVQKFFSKTPYERASFLATYASNGARAADAITRASRTYRINALVLIVLTQAAEGLVGELRYPFPPERVEFAFRCGCLQGADCVGELAGFDRQVDCVARRLRESLDQIAKGGKTTSGWGLDVTSVTLDNLKVTPVNEATAVLYDFIPKVAEDSSGGTWLFWNLWNVYAQAISYAGPIDGGGDGRWIGAACETPDQCGYEGATCSTDFPDGVCTAPCTGECPTQADKPEAFCAAFKGGDGFCLEVCNPGNSACRQGYSCIRLRRVGSTTNSDSKHVCTLP